MFKKENLYKNGAPPHTREAQRSEIKRGLGAAVTFKRMEEGSE